MPTVLTDIPPRAEPPRKRWTREEYEAISGPGLKRVELVEGELISNMGRRPAHVTIVLLMRIWLAQAFGDLFVRKKDPINVSSEDNVYSEPEPDLAVTAREVTYYAKSHPDPSEIRLVVEVADTTLTFDRTTKARLYARAGIADYWIVDIQSRRMIVHRDPAGGEYRSVIAYAAHEKVAPLTAAQSELLVGDVFPL